MGEATARTTHPLSHAHVIRLCLTRRVRRVCSTRFTGHRQLWHQRPRSMVQSRRFWSLGHRRQRPCRRRLSQQRRLVWRSRVPVLRRAECREVLGRVEAWHRAERGGVWGTVRRCVGLG